MAHPLTFTLLPTCTIKVSAVLGFTAVCFLASLNAPVSGNTETILLSRQKRLSVLNVIYRKGNTSDGGGVQVFGRPHYHPSRAAMTTSPAMTTPLPDFIAKFTVAPAEITATIAKLRTTRLKFSMTTRSHFPLPDENTPPSSTSPPVLDIPRRFPLDHPLNYPSGEFVPFYSVPPNPRNSNPDRVREPLFFPALYTTTHSPSPPPFYTSATSEPLRSTYLTVKTRPPKPESFNPSFHELMPTRAPPATSVQPLTAPPTITFLSPSPSSPSRSQTPSPTFQARLNINPERKGVTYPRKDTTTRPTTLMTTTPPVGTGTPVVTGSPAHVDCRGKIGYFSDVLAADCDAFLYCDQFGRSYKFLCPIGTKFNPRMCLCDMHSRCSTSGPVVSPDDPCPPLI